MTNLIECQRKRLLQNLNCSGIFLAGIGLYRTVGLRARCEPEYEGVLPTRLRLSVCSIRLPETLFQLFGLNNESDEIVTCMTDKSVRMWQESHGSLCIPIDALKTIRVTGDWDQNESPRNLLPFFT